MAAKKKPAAKGSPLAPYWQDILTRAARTFVQAAASAGLLGALIGGNITGIRAALYAGGAAAASFLWNIAVAWSETR